MAAESEQGVALPPVIPVQKLKQWLPDIFPAGVGQRNYVVREMSAKAIFVMLYTGAIEGSGIWFRPAQATLMSDAQAAKIRDGERLKWRQDSLVAGRLRPPRGRWYAANTREPIRDETLRSGLIPLGAVIERSGLPTTSALPRYALSARFAQLLDELHRGRAGQKEIARWQEQNLNPGEVARVRLMREGFAKPRQGERVSVLFPDGHTRPLHPGPSAVITKAVIEEFARRFLRAPVVLLVSESRKKTTAVYEELTRIAGLRIETDRNLPDIILMDVTSGQQKLVFVEVVATSGAMTQQRREAHAKVAEAAKFPPESVHFVTAFFDRRRPEFRQAVGEIALDTYAWCATEPDLLICFRAKARVLLDRLPD